MFARGLSRQARENSFARANYRSAPWRVSCVAYRAANGASTSLQAGDSDAALLAMHCTMRPPPGATPAQSERMSAPQAERTMNSSSRGSSGRRTITAGAAAAAGAAPVAGAAAAAPPPAAAVTAFAQADETLALFF